MELGTGLLREQGGRLHRIRRQKRKLGLSDPAIPLHEIYPEDKIRDVAAAPQTPSWVSPGVGARAALRWGQLPAGSAPAASAGGLRRLPRGTPGPGLLPGAVAAWKASGSGRTDPSPDSTSGLSTAYLALLIPGNCKMNGIC